MDLSSASEIYLSCTGALVVTAAVYAVLVVYAVQSNEHRLHRPQNLRPAALAGSIICAKDRPLGVSVRPL